MCVLFQLRNILADKCLVAQGRPSQKGGAVVVRDCDPQDTEQVSLSNCCHSVIIIRCYLNFADDLLLFAALVQIGAVYLSVIIRYSCLKYTIIQKFRVINNFIQQGH